MSGVWYSCLEASTHSHFSLKHYCLGRYLTWIADSKMRVKLYLQKATYVDEPFDGPILVPLAVKCLREIFIFIHGPP